MGSGASRAPSPNLRERHFPHGRLELVVHLGRVYRRVEGAGTHPFSRTCISGLQTQSDVIEAPRGASAVLGIQLHPLGAFRLLGRPIHELTGFTEDLEALMGSAARELADRLVLEAEPARRVRQAEEWIRSRIRPTCEADPAVVWALGELERTSGTISVGRLQGRSGCSRTRFTSMFREQVGVTPKRFARLLRFRRALEMVGRGDRELVDVALATGYYDQPHFNAEFREFSGFTPGDYRRQLRFPDSMSVAAS
jgi:AraC-like DNA-binding protein